MKKIVLAVLLIMFSFPAVAKDKESAYDRVMKTGIIKCGYGLWDPFISYNFETQKPKGVVVDVMEKIAEKISVKLDWGQELGWGNMPTDLKDGKIDVACASLWNDPARGRLVAFTDPVFYMTVHAYVAEDSNLTFKSVEGINNSNIRISVQEGDFTAEIAKRLFPEAQQVSISPQNNFSEMLLNVVSGKADVILINSANVELFNKKNEKKLKKVNFSKPIMVYGNSFAVSIHEPELKEVLNTAVKNLIQIGEIEELTADFRAQYPDEILLPLTPYETSQ